MTTNQKGQAWYVLRGYRYQLLLSLDAWLTLGPDEILFLETEEDFSVQSETVSIDTQVKSSAAAGGPKPHSLRSQDVRAVLNRFWTRSDGGKNLRPQLAFIAQGGIARETGLAFPNNVAGIEYWRACALGADTGPIRTALASLFNGEPLGEWINSNPSDMELRARLLSRVRWMTDALPEGPLVDLIRDRIAEIYLEKGLWVTFADEAVHSLFDRVFEAATQLDATERRLSALDLHRSIEVMASPLLTLQSAARAASSSVVDAPEGLLISAVDLPSGNVAERHETVSAILEQTRGEPLIWFHGTHGVGKSTLARLIATRIGGTWLGLDLRAVQDDARATLAAWRELLRTLHQSPHVSGIVIDDFAGPAMDALRTRLSAFIASATPQGTRVVITSPHEPSSARLAELRASPKAALQAPYLTESDVRELVAVPPAPTNDAVDGWTKLLLVTTNFGHPLLVAAKVASLKSRGWPAAALVEDFGSTSDAVRTTREEARRRLVDEIPSPEARQLLRRLGNVFDRADDSLVLKLAHQEPQIPNAGDALAILRGSWIEVVPGNDLRLSPLISDIGKDLGDEEIKECRRTAAEHWLGTGALNQRTLPLCFWNAFWADHPMILAHICQAVETLPHDQLRGAAALLSPMTLLTTQRSLYPDVPPIAAMLRLLQVEVASAVEDGETAAKAANTLISEIDAIDHEELRLLSASIAIPKILLAEHINISPDVQLGWVLRLRTILQSIVAMGDPDLSSATQWLTTAFPPGADFLGFLFTVIVTRIRSSARMLAMIEAMNALNESDRNSFLDTAKIMLGMSGGAFVHNGWAQEQLDNLDLRPALTRFERMSNIVQQWARPDVQAELANARSVILDEGLNDQQAALAIVDDAINLIGNTPTLIRQKAKVLGHSGEDRAAAQLLMSVEDVVGSESLLDRALALRDGGVSAARAHLFSDALRMFQKAHTALVAEGQHPGLATGMQVESALISWEMGNRPEALSTLADALDAVESLDPVSSRQNERAHQFARATVGLFWHKIDPYPSNPTRSIAVGQASALTGDEALLGIDLKPLPHNWRILALCEIELGVDVGIERRSLAKQTGRGLASIEMFIAMARYRLTISKGNDFENALRLGLLAAHAYWVTKRVRDGEVDPDRSALDPSRILKLLLQEGLGEIIETIPVDILLWQRYRGKWDAGIIAGIEKGCIAAWGDVTPIAEVLAAASAGSVSGRPVPTVALAASVATAPNLAGNPRARFERDLLLVSYVSHSFARRLIEPVIVPIISDGWSAVVANEGFALTSPMEHTPAIEDALGKTESLGLRAAAQLLLAAAPAVKVPLTGNWLALLRQIAE